MLSRPVLTLCIAGSLAVAGGAWWHLRGDRERSAAHAREVAELRDAVARAESGRGAQADQIARLEAALAAATAPVLTSNAAAPPVPLPTPRDADAVEEDAVAEQPQAPSLTDLHAGMAGTPIGSFDPEALIAAGFHRQDVERLRTRLDEIEMKRLYLRDQASRESWIETPRFLQESRALLGELSGLRQEFDDPLYDWMLYSTGHPNRVAVQGVLEGSAGELAGLLRGDLIVRYDEQLVLSAGELRDATIAGRAGELVAVEVQREGESAPRRIFVPRGPIGITLGPASQKPPPAG